MSKIEFDFSFRRDISQIRDAGHSTLSSSLPKDFSGYGLSLNNTSRFEEKKVLRKLRDQELLNRITAKLQRFSENQQLAKEALKFRPVRSKKGRLEKENNQ